VNDAQNVCQYEDCERWQYENTKGRFLVDEGACVSESPSNIEKEWHNVGAWANKRLHTTATALASFGIIARRKCLGGCFGCILPVRARLRLVKRGVSDSGTNSRPNHQEET